MEKLTESHVFMGTQELRNVYIKKKVKEIE